MDGSLDVAIGLACACFISWIVVFCFNNAAGILIGYIFAICLGAVVALVVLVVTIDKLCCF